VVHSVDVYRGGLRRAIVEYKYGHQLDWAPRLASVLAGFIRDHHPWFEEYDLLTGMPAFLGAGARRTWSPVGRMVADLAPLLGPGWAVRPDLVVKTAETESMSGRSRWERTRIAEGPLRRALSLGGTDLSGARILVVDDVFTEGSTLREVARVLRAGGAEEVAGVVLARPPLGGLDARPWPAVPGASGSGQRA
jgi:predicted amidophosphoribosyltransferase